MRYVAGLMIVGMAMLAGCQAARPDLASTGGVSVKSNETSATRIYAVSARQVGEELLVSGSVRRAYSDESTIIWGHVDVVAYDASGKRITGAVAEQSHEQLPTSGSRSALFSARLPIHADAGTVLQVEHHMGSPASDGCRAQ